LDTEAIDAQDRSDRNWTDARIAELKARLAEAQSLRDDVKIAFQAMRAAGLMNGVRTI